jgi:beta-glucanase (GH16 family)
MNQQQGNGFLCIGASRTAGVRIVCGVVHQLMPFVLLLLLCALAVDVRADEPYKLVWHDEFNTDGRPDSTNWNYENGFVRNEELQWYQADNAVCKDGVLMITARSEKRPNPLYRPDARDWRCVRKEVTCTSACLTTMGKREFLYGRIEVRARLPIARGSWPAIWTLGRQHPWPSCGEIDIMEFYHINGVPHLLANVACGTDQRSAPRWHTETRPFAHFLEKDPYWGARFHVWRMDWDADSICLYVDGELMNKTLLKNTVNGRIGNYDNPFRTPQYILLNLAVGGQSGGPVDEDALPMRYEVDYVRVYQKTAGA